MNVEEDRQRKENKQAEYRYISYAIGVVELGRTDQFIVVNSMADTRKKDNIESYSYDEKEEDDAGKLLLIAIATGSAVRTFGSFVASFFDCLAHGRYGCTDAAIVVLFFEVGSDMSGDNLPAKGIGQDPFYPIACSDTEAALVDDTYEQYAAIVFRRA